MVNNKELKIILTHVSTQYNIPFNILNTEINNILKSSQHNIFNKTKCHAYIMLDGNKTQCSRSKKEDHFCLTHFKQNEKNILKYGKINPNKINKQINSQESIENKQNYKKPLQVEYLTINDIDYLYNSNTKTVYDFDTREKLGKLDNKLNIIKKYKLEKNEHK